ncbi:MAG: hypothetical protein WC223_11185 [Bacteroidales bacterium]|jgi:hypothetical protein
MKKIAFCLMAACLSLTFYPFQSNAATTAAASSIVVSKPAESKVLLKRLNEINAMDKSNLKLSDKKNLRNEVISISNQLRGPTGGIYISVGALIIILLLLIILL